MGQSRRLEVRNYASFIPAIDGGNSPYKVVADSEGNEIGIEVKGLLTTFDLVNANGMTFNKDSYDKFVTNYFKSNDLNIPVDVMHQQDFHHLVGIAKSFVKTDANVEITAFVPSGIALYNDIKVKLDNGILQGFSNFGIVNDYDITENNELVIKDFALLSASLVSIPADTGAKFVSNATEFKGFGKQEPEVENTINPYFI